MCEVMVLPAIVQTESTVIPVADFCTSRLEQLAPEEDACDCMAWSVAASMHCFIVMGWLATWVVICHRPAWREGMSGSGRHRERSDEKQHGTRTVHGILPHANPAFRIGFEGDARA